MGSSWASYGLQPSAGIAVVYTQLMVRPGADVVLAVTCDATCLVPVSALVQEGPSACLVPVPVVAIDWSEASVDWESGRQ